MKNRVPEVFLSEMFGELRIMEDDNKFYFCAADVCSALGYSNPSHELNIHCRHDDAVPYTLDDCKEFDDLPLYIAGEWVKDEFERYHNFYAVFEQDAAL